MATEKIEIEIIAKGKPAEKAIQGVERKTKDLGTQSKQTGKEVDGVLTRMRAGWIAVGASVVKAVSEAAKFERASIGLSASQKRWAQEVSLATDIQAEQVAGFLKSAQTAGLAEEQMKDLAKQSIALGYAFPHENAETLNDNMIMLARTGEAQGFVVDILEQKYTALGEDINNLDLKTKSWSEKMALVGEVAEKSQAQMDASKYKDLNKVIGTMDKAFTDVGHSLVVLGSESGGFGLVTNVLNTFSLALQFVTAGVTSLTKDIPKLFEALGLWTDKQAKLVDGTDKQKTAEEQLSYALQQKKDIMASIHILTGSALEGAKKQLKMLDKQIASIKKHGDALEESRQQINKSKQAHADAKAQEVADANSAWGKMKKGFGDYVKDVNNKAVTLRQTGAKVAQGMEDAFVNMAMGVKTSFKDMARAVIADLIRIQAREAIVGLIGRLGFHTGTAEVKHTGGAIGSTRIPSFHTGVRSDERLAKLQVGEAVINRGGAAKNRDAIDAMNKGYSVGGQGGQVTTAEINFNAQAIDASSFNSYLVNNRGTIEGIINASLTSNGSVRRTIKQVV